MEIKKGMKQFKQFLDEARRNPELNPKISIYKALEPYKDRDDMHITYTADVGKSFSGVTGKNISGFKVGINPKSTYNTPNGIYIYPLKQAWKRYANKMTQKLEVPYMGDQPTVALLQQTPGANVVDVSEISSKDYDRDFMKLAKMIIAVLTKNGRSEAYAWEYAKGILNLAQRSSRDKSPGGIWWNMTRYTFFVLYSNRKKLASFFANDVPPPEYKDEVNAMIEDPNMKANFGDMTNRLYKIIQFGRVDTKSSNIWSKIFLDLGVDGVTDRRGKRIIHPSEPMQGVFFNPRAYKVINSFYNKDHIGLRSIRYELREYDYAIWDINIISNADVMEGSLMLPDDFIYYLIQSSPGTHMYEINIDAITSSINSSLNRNNCKEARIYRDENWYLLEAWAADPHYKVPDEEGNPIDPKVAKSILGQGKWKFTFYCGTVGNPLITITPKGITFEKAKSGMGRWTKEGPLFAPWELFDEIEDEDGSKAQDLIDVVSKK